MLCHSDNAAANIPPVLLGSVDFSSLNGRCCGIVEELDAVSCDADIDSVYSRIVTSIGAASKHARSAAACVRSMVGLVCMWAVNGSREQTYAAAIATELLKKHSAALCDSRPHISSARAESIAPPLQSVLVDFLDTYESNAQFKESEWKRIEELFSELSRSNVFSYEAYVAWIVAHSLILDGVNKGDVRAARHERWVRCVLCRTRRAQGLRRMVLSLRADEHEEEEEVRLRKMIVRGLSKLDPAAQRSHASCSESVWQQFTSSRLLEQISAQWGAEAAAQAERSLADSLKPPPVPQAFSAAGDADSEAAAEDAAQHVRSVPPQMRLHITEWLVRTVVAHIVPTEGSQLEWPARLASYSEPFPCQQISEEQLLLVVHILESAMDYPLLATFLLTLLSCREASRFDALVLSTARRHMKFFSITQLGVRLFQLCCRKWSEQRLDARSKRADRALLDVVSDLAILHGRQARLNTRKGNARAGFDLLCRAAPCADAELLWKEAEVVLAVGNRVGLQLEGSANGCEPDESNAEVIEAIESIFRLENAVLVAKAIFNLLGQQLDSLPAAAAASEQRLFGVIRYIFRTAIDRHAQNGSAQTRKEVLVSCTVLLREIGALWTAVNIDHIVLRVLSAEVRQGTSANGGTDSVDSRQDCLVVFVVVLLTRGVIHFHDLLMCVLFPMLADLDADLDDDMEDKQRKEGPSTLLLLRLMRVLLTDSSELRRLLPRQEAEMLGIRRREEPAENLFKIAKYLDFLSRRNDQFKTLLHQLLADRTFKYKAVEDTKAFFNECLKDCKNTPVKEFQQTLDGLIPGAAFPMAHIVTTDNVAQALLETLMTVSCWTLRTCWLQVKLQFDELHKRESERQLSSSSIGNGSDMIDTLQARDELKCETFLVSLMLCVLLNSPSQVGPVRPVGQHGAVSQSAPTVRRRCGTVCICAGAGAGRADAPHGGEA